MFFPGTNDEIFNFWIVQWASVYLSLLYRGFIDLHFVERCILKYNLNNFSITG